MQDQVKNVLRLYRLSVPPLFLVLACYVLLSEHVFGLAYVIGKRLKPRMRATFRTGYRLGTGAIALGIHIYLLHACGDRDSNVCPPTRYLERHCLAITAVASLFCGLMLIVERWANPLLDLKQPVGLRARACAAAGLMAAWICIANEQLCGQFLLLLLTAQRVLATFPKLGYYYALALKFYAMIHMTRVLSQRCDGIPKLSVATVAAMSVL
jgi:hypothetical protein